MFLVFPVNQGRYLALTFGAHKSESDLYSIVNVTSFKDILDKINNPY